MPSKTSINRPPLGEFTPDSPILLPLGFQLLSQVTNWRGTWSHVVSGKFSDSPYSGLLCYDRDDGVAAFYDTDGLGGLRLLQEDDTWRTTWTHIVPGVFGESGYDGVLLFNSQTGLAAIYDTDGQGNLVPLHENDTGRTSWTHIVVAPFFDSPYSGVLLYDQSSGFGSFYSTDGQGRMNHVNEYHGWLNTWTHIVAGMFSLDPTANDPYPQFASLFFYDSSARYGETYKTDGHGHIAMLGSQSGFPQATDILPGNFGCSARTKDHGPQEWTNLLFYSRVLQSGTIFALGDAWIQDNNYQFNFWREVEPISTTPSPAVFTQSRHSRVSGQFPPVSRPWSLLITGNFWMADPEDQYFGETGKYPQYRYFYNGGFTDFLFYDQTDGYAEFYLKESAQTTPLDPLAGYVSIRPPNANAPKEHSGSAIPGETVSFHISSQVGPYRIDVYRQSAGLVFMTSVPVTGIPRPYGISRTAYRDGAKWPEVASLTIPAHWPSGLYLARVQTGIPPQQTGNEGTMAPGLGRTAPVPEASNVSPEFVAGPRINRASVFGDRVTLDIPIIIRSAAPGTRASILLAAADTTYEAYNYWGGRSLYGHGCRGVDVTGEKPTLDFLWANDNNWMMPRAFRVSFQRPFASAVGYTRLQTFEIPLIQWLEHNGIRVDVCAMSDLHKYSDLLQNYQLFVSVGHDEYWSQEMRDNVGSFIVNGGNAAFFSGNVCWWRVQFENDGNTMVCYKNKNLDPETILWDDSGMPSAGLTGVSGAKLWPIPPNPPQSHQFFLVQPNKHEHWVFRNTRLYDGAGFGVYIDWTADPPVRSVVGPETDTIAKGSPPFYDRLASAYMEDGTEAGTMITFKAGLPFEQGGTVFAAGTINWALGLSQPDSGQWGVIDQITWNVFNQLG